VFTCLYYLLLALLLASNSVSAHGGACGCSAGIQAGGLAGPIITLPAYTLPKGVFSVSAGASYLNSGRFSQSQITSLISKKQHADDLNSNLTSSLNMAYGITDDLSISASMPFSNGFAFHEVHDGELEQLGNSIGFGGLTLLSQYRFLNSEKHKFQSAILAGVKLPTGNSSVKADNGETFETINQPSSGSTDPMFGLAVSKTFSNKVNLDANFLYKLSTEGKASTDVGDLASYNVAVSYPVHHTHKDPFQHSHDHEEHKGNIFEKLLPEHIAWDLIFEVNTLAQGVPEIDNRRVPNHGGVTVFLSPGVRMTLNDRVVYNISAGFPVVEVYEGEQAGYDFRLFMGLATSFGAK
jgi:hypothetical protein